MKIVIKNNRVGTRMEIGSAEDLKDKTIMPYRNVHMHGWESGQSDVCVYQEKPGKAWKTFEFRERSCARRRKGNRKLMRFITYVSNAIGVPLMAVLNEDTGDIEWMNVSVDRGKYSDTTRRWESRVESFPVDLPTNLSMLPAVERNDLILQEMVYDRIRRSVAVMVEAVANIRPPQVHHKSEPPPVSLEPAFIRKIMEEE